MFVEITAVPEVGASARRGERFTPREGAPLRIGPGPDARLRLPGLGANVELALVGGALTLLVPRSSVRASLCGVELAGGSEHHVGDGDTLYVHPGLVLTARERPVVSRRQPGLEGRIREVDDDATWAVYADFLEEGGDPLAQWIRQGGQADEGARLRQLGPLADAVRGGLVETTFDTRGFLRTARLTRQAVVGAPGLTWLLEQLATLPVARFLRELSLALFAGAAPARVDDEQDPDTLAAATLERLRGADFAPSLRKLTLGFVRAQRAWPRASAAFEGWCADAPLLAPDFAQIIRAGGRARLVLVASPPDIRLVSDDVTLSPTRTNVGSDESCLVRLVGPAPEVFCTLRRMTDGQWVVTDERADPFSRQENALTLRVNGAPLRQAHLVPDDEIEPTPGLRLRFVLS